MGSDEAEALFTEAERMAEKAEDRWSHAILLTAYGGIRAQCDGMIREYPGLTRQSLAVAEESGDPALYVVVSVGSYAFLLVGEHREGMAVLDRAIEIAAGDPAIGAGIAVDCPLAYCHVFRGGFLGDMGRLDEARESIERGMKLAGEQGAIETVGWGHMMSAGHAWWSGEPDRIATHAKQALEIAERIGDGLSRAWGWFWVGSAACRQGEWAQAVEALERSLAICHERRAASESEGWSLMTLGEAHLGLGEPERAVDLAREGVALFRERGQIGEALASVILARVLLGSEGLAAREEIESALARADEMVRGSDYRSLEPLIHVERAELARQGGDEDERERELREAHRLFTEIGATRPCRAPGGRARGAGTLTAASPVEVSSPC